MAELTANKYQVLFLTKKMPLVNGRTKYSKGIYELFNSRSNASFVEIELPDLSKASKTIFRILCLFLFVPSIWIESYLTKKVILKKLNGLQSGDILVLDHFQFWWVIFSKSLKEKNVKVILLSHNLEVSNKWSYVRYGSLAIKLVALFETISIFIWEKLISRKGHAIIAINSHEQEVYSKWSKEKPAFLIYPYTDKLISKNKNTSLAKSLVAMVGSYGYKAKEMNTLWLIELYNEISGRISSDLILHIIGRGASKKLKESAGKAKPVRFIGEVESLKEWYDKSIAAIVPERLGGGFKLKIIEAVSFDVPLIIHRNALLGSGFEEGIDCLAFENGVELSQSLKLVHEDTELSKKLREKAIEKVNLLYSKERALKEIDRLLSSI